MPHRSPSSFDFTAIETLVRQHFLHIITKVAGLAHLIDFDPSQPLDISQYPVAQRALDKFLQQLHNDLAVDISSSMWQAWETANDKMDALVLKHLPKAPDAYFLRNHEALQALLSRKERGLDLSQRVWRITQQFEEEVTMALDLGLRNGEDAATLARTLRQHLNQPDKLFRRVRDEHGMLHLSKRAKAYHPGQGVYRSSFKNARRLAATETNMAYRTADYERWQQLDFVVGIRIELSNNHTCLGADGKPHRFHDICDDLQGKYPKDFKFTGWHPHCRCHATPILKTPEEMDRDDEAILRGERPSSESQNTVHTPPPALDKWMEKNKDRIAASKARGTLPYFIKDNKAVFGLEEKRKTTPPKTEKKQEKKTEKFDYDKPNAALDNYISGEGMWVNNYLRGRSDMGELYPDEKEYLAQLTKATSIERVGERTLWRSVDAQAVFGEKLSDGDFEDLRSHYLYGQTHKVILQKIDPYLHLEGKIVEEKGFMSTTKSEEIAKEFGNYTGSRRPVLLKIKTNEHTMGVDVERYTLKHRPEVEQREPQKEVLLQRGQRMRVLSVGDRGGHLCVEVELVNQQAKVVAKKTPLDIAKERHAKRTKAQEEEIRKRWEERKVTTEITLRKRRAAKRLEEWWKLHLPMTKHGRRFVVQLNDGKKVVINKNFYKEEITHYPTSEWYEERLETAQYAHEHIVDAIYRRIEAPRHNKGVIKKFLVYEKRIGQSIYEFKIKEQRDGLYLHFMKNKKEE